MLRVSRKEQDIILRKIQLGHLYDIHVCTVDRWDRILASSEHTRIQTKTLNQAPILRVTYVGIICFVFKLNLSFSVN